MNGRTSSAARVKRLSPAAAVAGATLLLLAACSGKSSSQLTVTAAKAKQGTIEKTVEFSGALAPDQTVNVFSELPGHAVRVNANVGDSVKAGELLVQIDTRQLQAELAEANAAVRSVEDQAAKAKLGIETAKSNLDLARTTFDRIQALYKTQAASKNQLDDAQNKLTLAQSAYQNAQQSYDLLTGSSLAQARAHVDLINVQLSNSMVTSPLSGVVTNRNVNPGELVGMSAPVMTIADTSILKLQGTVSQDIVPLLSLGRAVKISVDGMPSLDVEGKISQIGPVAAATGQYFPVVVRVKNDGKLLAGMTAMASFVVSSAPGVVVPTSAVQRDGEDYYAYVIKNGAVYRKKVLVGLQSSSDTLITAGLVAGDDVATSNIGVLGNGAAVTVVTE